MTSKQIIDLDEGTATVSMVPSARLPAQPAQQGDATLSVNLGPFLQDGLSTVHMDNEMTAVFWLRSYLKRKHNRPAIEAADLDFDHFVINLHFGYSVQKHSIGWDPRGLVTSLDCEYVARDHNAWITALVVMQNQKFVEENRLPCHFHVVDYIDFGERQIVMIGVGQAD